jgi:hypothetical protein
MRWRPVFFRPNMASRHTIWPRKKFRPALIQVGVIPDIHLADMRRATWCCVGGDMCDMCVCVCVRVCAACGVLRVVCCVWCAACGVLRVGVWQWCVLWVVW